MPKAWATHGSFGLRTERNSFALAAITKLMPPLYEVKAILESSVEKPGESQSGPNMW
jgi:hypothetical protein